MCKMSESCKSCFPDSNNNSPNCFRGQGASGRGGYTGATPPMPPRKVQVTAKILFGSVSAITTMKNQEKAAKRKPQVKFNILATMFILITIQGVRDAAKISETPKTNHIDDRPRPEGKTARWTGKSWLKGLAAQLRLPGDTVLTNDSPWKYVEKAGNVTVAVSVNNFTVVNKNNGYVNRKEEGDDDVHKWSSSGDQLEATTTDFYLNSSDFNAKDFVEEKQKSPSKPNVPEKVEKVDQLSFINNISTPDDTKEFENKEEGNKKEDGDYMLQKTAEVLAKEQKNLLIQVTDFGLWQMRERDVKEKEIYDAGYYLQKGSPGSYLAAFNQQSEELKKLSRYGFAALKASARLKEELENSKLRQELFNVTEDSTKEFPEISLLDTSLHDDCPIKSSPRCPTWKHLFRTADGTCNNLNNPWWGAIFQPLKRFLPPHYSDGLESVRSSVRGGPLPSARMVSNEVHWDKDVSSRSVTHMFMQWGQFIDHDMTSSSQSRGFNGSVPRCCDTPPELLHPDCLPIEVPPEDRFYSRFGIRCLEFLRSAPSSRVGCGLGPREQVNQVTSYIDGSMIYGNTEAEASRLRLFRNGMLKYTRMPQRLPLLPSDRNRGEFCRGSTADFFCFHSGDFRMNEQPGLMALHVLFLRLHNRLTRQLAHVNPLWSDERLYQETRKIVGAILQHITYREFLPIVLGQEVMRIFDLEPLREGYYKDYSEKVSSSAANAFAAAAFRFGHSMVQGRFLRWDDIRKEAIANITLHEELQDPGVLHRFGAVDNLLLGMCVQEAQKRDEHFTVELTNHLFQTPSFPAGLDLAAINIQRGRDHGLPSYNSWRNPCGLRRIKSWDELLHVIPEDTRDSLRRVYRDINDIDLYVGGLSEFSVRGGLIGSTFACIIGQHFKNLRRGDRFWYENGGFDSSFTLSQLKVIRRVTLARLLCDNLDLIETIQPFAFLTVDNLRNPKVPCRSREIPAIDLSPWEETPKGKWVEKAESSSNEVPIPEMPDFKSEQEFSSDVPNPNDFEEF